MQNSFSASKFPSSTPLVNGYINARLKIDSSLKDGRYAFNFLLQKTFFSITGHLANATKDDKLLNYIMIARNKQTVVDFVQLNEQQSFVVKNMLFQDSAFFVFARPRQKNNQLLMTIATPLDSAFTASATVTKFIVVGNVKNDAAAISTDTTGYVFKPDETKYKIMMPEVVVKTRSNKRLQDFDRENSTGVFSGSDAIMLDGISSDELENAPDLYTYLTVKVGGLRLVTDSETGNRSFSWRGEPTEIYINEIKLDPDIPLWINPSDIAMIKVFRPGTSLSSGASNGGAIAIYTKTGEYSKSTNRNYSFFINGYTGLEAVWK